MNRQFFVFAHRYVGLVITLFLVIAGFTGIFLAFYNELDNWINQDMAFVQKPSADAKLIDPFKLREMMIAQYPQANFDRVELTPLKPNHVYSVYLEPKINLVTQKPYDLENDELYVNPYTGEVLGERKWGAISQGVKNLMPFVYQLHYSLALGTIGSYAFGMIALLWTLDCFVGAYLTFPAKQKTQKNRPLHPHPNPLPKGEGVLLQQLHHSEVHQQSLSFWERVAARSGEGKAWLNRWWKSWKIRWHGGFYKVNFDLHRAGGLWLWAMLFVFAWSSVGFNLSEIYQPITKTLFETQAKLDDTPALKTPLLNPALDFKAAYQTAKELAASEAQKHHFKLLGENALSYDSHHGTYQYRFKSNLDVSEKYGQTSLFFNSNTGQHILTYLPTGKASGDTITSWIMQLHMAGLWGLSMQIFVSCMGLVVTGLAITGLMIWLKKRKSRNFVKRLDKTKKIVTKH